MEKSNMEGRFGTTTLLKIVRAQRGFPETLFCFSSAWLAGVFWLLQPLSAPFSALIVSFFKLCVAK